MEGEVAMFSTPTCAARSVTEWRAHPACHAQLCLGGAPASRAQVHHICNIGPLARFPLELGRGCPVTHLGQTWPRLVVHVPRLSRPRSPPISVTFPAYLGHLPRLVPSVP
ncbi:hypothetical protein PanWU01x14_178460 [Parasponia andersonii]|uniref:Uncharacterized protein n=1 Tax=Parasponia andersonii TaxID=3476 RepID=A0A2P5C793_PARAD|nr:hypothetical protein PanWU01x14_178460 [Parasponia andersonii]